MSDAARSVRVRRLPEIGARVPGVVTRVAVGVVGALLCLDRFPPGFFLVIGLVLTAIAVVRPRTLAAWALLLVLAASQLLRDPSPLDVRFFVLLAGMHLLHLLAAQTLALPWRGWVQVAAFRRPLLRFLVIQIPVQVVAFLALLLLAPRPDGSAAVVVPVAGIVGAAALVVLTLLLVVPLLSDVVHTRRT